MMLPCKYPSPFYESPMSNRRGETRTIRDPQRSDNEYCRRVFSSSHFISIPEITFSEERFALMADR